MARAIGVACPFSMIQETAIRTPIKSYPGRRLQRSACVLCVNLALNTGCHEVSTLLASSDAREFLEARVIESSYV